MAIFPNNGSQFINKRTKKFCEDLGVSNFYSTPGYPRSNGQAEISNKVLLDGIKKKLEDVKGR